MPTQSKPVSAEIPASALPVTIRYMKTKIALKYEGPALLDGAMDVYQTSANISGLVEIR